MILSAFKLDCLQSVSFQALHNMSAHLLRDKDAAEKEERIRRIAENARKLRDLKAANANAIEETS